MNNDVSFSVRPDNCLQSVYLFVILSNASLSVCPIKISACVLIYRDVFVMSILWRLLGCIINS